MGLSKHDPLRDKRDTMPPGPTDVHITEAPHDIGRLALILMGELSAFLQMIITDIARAPDLEEARARWLQRLLALPMVIERAMELPSTNGERSDLGRPMMSAASVPEAPDALIATTTDIPDIPGTSGISDISGLRESLGVDVAMWRRSQRISVVHAHGSHRSLRLTTREHQILNLADKGQTPRTIAKHLHLSVQTVYTHLRNARRKVRELDPLATR